MNIAFFLTPKTDVAYLFSDYSLRQALEKMHTHHYSAIPVIDREGKYVATVREGDFLWFLLENQEGQPLHRQDLRSLEDVSLKRLLPPEVNPPLFITADMSELLERAMEQNFVPVVDDSGVFIGIVTRRSIMQYSFSHPRE